jgi:hypothetical protein
MESLPEISPRLDAFAAEIAITRISFPSEMKEWVSSIRYVPGFVFYGGLSGVGYYRAHGCHELRLSPFTQDVVPFVMHIAVGQYDLAAYFLSRKWFSRSHFYEYYPTMITFAQACEGKNPPIGGQSKRLAQKSYIRLFHHTTTDGRNGILADRFVCSSRQNFCGTRELEYNYCYFTDIPQASHTLETLPMLIRRSGQEHVFFRTDDQMELVAAPVQINNRRLDCRLSFLIAPDLIQPNPMIYHMPIKSQPKWLEIAFPSIFRIPCSGLSLNKSIILDGEEHWIIDRDSVVKFRTKDPICCANGNDPTALLYLIDDCYAPSSSDQEGGRKQNKERKK